MGEPKRNYFEARIREHEELADRLEPMLQAVLDARGVASLASVPLDAEAVELRVAPHELSWIIEGLRSIRGYADETVRELRALLAFQEALGVDRFRAYAEARGINASDPDLRRRYDARSVVKTYLDVLRGGFDGGLEPGLAERITGHRMHPSVKLPPEPRTLQQALDATTEFHGFPTADACREYLKRARRKLSLDFQIPG